MHNQRLTSAQFQALAASKKRKIMGANNTEHQLQIECVQWFRLVHKNDGIIYAIPNGGVRDTTTAAKLRMEGALAGIPDLHIPVPRHGYASLYIEMKNGKTGRLSDHQKTMIERLRSLGNKVDVCRTFDEFVKTVEDYMRL